MTDRTPTGDYDPAVGRTNPMTVPPPEQLDEPPTGDLRERLAQEIHLHCPSRPYRCQCMTLADAVLPVVEAETAAKDADIERLGPEWVAAHNRATRNRQRAEKAERALAEQQQRAEQAYTQLAAVADDAVAARDRWRARTDEQRARAQRAERQRSEAVKARGEAEAAVERVRDLCARMRSHPDTRGWADRIEAALARPEGTP